MVKSFTGDDFELFTKEMFEDLDMPNTNFLSNYMAVVQNKARPYGNWNGWKEIPVITNVHGDGALFTTLRDQLKWEQIVQLNDGKYLSKEMIHESQLPLRSSIEDDYGYGLRFDLYGGWDRKYHDGATGGYRASFSRFPSDEVSIVVMSNNRNLAIDNLVKDVVAIVLGMEDNVSDYAGNPDIIEELNDIQELVGIYKEDGTTGTIIKIIEKEGALFRELYQRTPLKLKSEKGGMFNYETIPDLKINFTNIGKTNQKFTLYMATQKPSTYDKISDLDMNGFDRT